jgi:hypothetical protein
MMDIYCYKRECWARGLNKNMFIMLLHVDICIK